MPNDYVLLISTPKPDKLLTLPGVPSVGTSGPLNPKDADVAAVLKLFPVKVAPPAGGNNGFLEYHTAGSVDGGNGGGGDGGRLDTPLKVKFGFETRSYWNFRVCPPTTSTQEVRFPLAMRFEACLHFSNFADAHAFLSASAQLPAPDEALTRQQLLARVFVYVQLVAVTAQN